MKSWTSTEADGLGGRLVILKVTLAFRNKLVACEAGVPGRLGCVSVCAGCLFFPLPAFWRFMTAWARFSALGTGPCSGACVMVEVLSHRPGESWTLPISLPRHRSHPSLSASYQAPVGGLQPLTFPQRLEVLVFFITDALGRGQGLRF